MDQVNPTIHQIKDNLSQRSVSKKDEAKVMKAMMNDSEYHVATYNRTKDDDICVRRYYPGLEFRRTIANIVANLTHIPRKEAKMLVSQYEFNYSEAKSLIDFSKEFINTYLQTGRKLGLGGRDTSDIELMWKTISGKTASVPDRSNGDRQSVYVPEHGGIKTINPCPRWITE